MTPGTTTGASENDAAPRSSVRGASEECVDFDERGLAAASHVSERRRISDPSGERSAVATCFCVALQPERDDVPGSAAVTHRQPQSRPEATHRYELQRLDHREALSLHTYDPLVSRVCKHTNDRRCGRGS